jgi:hypothetical protein
MRRRWLVGDEDKDEDAEDEKHWTRRTQRTGGGDAAEGMEGRRCLLAPCLRCVAGRRVGGGVADGVATSGVARCGAPARGKAGDRVGRTLGHELPNDREI